MKPNKIFTLKKTYFLLLGFLLPFFNCTQDETCTYDAETGDYSCLGASCTAEGGNGFYNCFMPGGDTCVDATILIGERGVVHGSWGAKNDQRSNVAFPGDHEVCGGGPHPGADVAYAIEIPTGKTLTFDIRDLTEHGADPDEGGISALMGLLNWCPENTDAIGDIDEEEHCVAHHRSREGAISHTNTSDTQTFYILVSSDIGNPDDDESYAPGPEDTFTLEWSIE